MTWGTGLSCGGRVPAALFVTALYRSAPTGSLVEVRFRTRSGMAQRFYEVERLDRVVETILVLARRTDVYVGVLPRRRRGGGRADLVNAASVVWVDCDTSSSIAALRRFRPEPGMVVGSGSGHNCHAYWFLEKPVELDVIACVNSRLAVTLNADRRCTDPARILRPAGSVNRKQCPPAAVRLLRWAQIQRVPVAELERCSLAEPRGLLARPAPRALPSSTNDSLTALPPRVYFERLTGQRVGRSGKARCPFHELSVGEATAGGVLPARSLADASSNGRVSPDPLLLVPPPVYFERLTGLRVGRSGKLRCLFHDDRHPSLHVYREAGRGWYCFGCGRGGSVYDLAALLSGRKTRGTDFLELRRELEKLLLPLRLVSNMRGSFER